MADQDQFLDVIDRDEAERRFRAAFTSAPCGLETIPLTAALGRVLATDVIAQIDVPGFDRSNFDGYALRAADTYGASELEPRRVRLLSETLEAGVVPQSAVQTGEAVAISTGGMLPRGADAVLMVEHADATESEVLIRRAVAAGAGIAYAGTDMARGETVLRQGTVLTSRDTGVLAAIGESQVTVWRRPRVGIISTGNEILAPGSPPLPATVYDSNSQVLADAVRELGGEPTFYGIVRDDHTALRSMLHSALADSDLVLLSGGTSKGKGDLCYRVVAELRDPGIVAHGVALKPGKPLCLAVTGGKPLAVLPGFPTSAVFTFHEFLAPVLREMAGRPAERPEIVTAQLGLKVNSEIGRTEYLLVSLVHAQPSEPSAEAPRQLIAFPLGKGSGSVTTFSRADGFVTIPRQTEIVAAGTSVSVTLLGRGLQPADLVIIGSHCVGLDRLLSWLQRRGITSKFLMVGSSAGLAAAQRGDCDIAGIHLFDPQTETYNAPFVDPQTLQLVPGYRRVQGIAFRPDDPRFAGRTIDDVVARLRTPDETVSPLVMVNRNQGSGTRILVDRLLQGQRPSGYAVQPTNHHAVAAAILQGRADWGLTIETVAHAAGLGFLPYQPEHYDFVIPHSRRARPAVAQFCEILADPAFRSELADLGLLID